MTLVGKVYRQGFYWPTAVTDAAAVVKKCEGCQFFARQSHVPAHALRMIPMTWPFATWGLDIVGPFKKAPGGFTHLFVAVDKFSKWIEAEPVPKTTTAKAIKFLQNIFVRFGTPRCIITDNGPQFTSDAFREFASDLGINVKYASVAHPQSNGQVERANGMILSGLKPRIFDRLKPYAGKWVQEMPSILWGLRTNVSRATGTSPFSLVYGSEAVLPTEVNLVSARVQCYDENEYDDQRHVELVAAEEMRDQALIRVARYHQSLRRYHDRNVRTRQF